MMNPLEWWRQRRARTDATAPAAGEATAVVPESPGATALPVPEPASVPPSTAQPTLAPLMQPTQSPPAEPRAPQRRGLIPSWVPWAAGGAGIFLLLVLGFVILLTRTASVRVPDLAGLDRATAAKRASEIGLTLVVRDTNFSATVPAGSVIDQSPVPGTIVSDGATVRVDLSAGSESFAMPNVVGQTLDAARRALRDRGLDVQFETAPSDADQGTVISSLPSAGATVTTGDVVRLTVAAGVSSTSTLLPSNLTGLSFVLDPAPAPTGSSTDVSFDIARRVRALLEASGARVTVTRLVTDTPAEASSLIRLRHARESTATALVGFSVVASGLSGLQVLSPPDTGTAAATFVGTTSLSQALLTSLRADFASITATTVVGDTVLEGVGVPSARIALGSNSSSSDRLSFSDPQWADNVAQDVYRALARAYGRS